MAENFVAFVERNALRLGPRTALHWEGGSLAWSELDRRASDFARSLSRQGVAAGDRVGVLAPNRWSFVVALLGTFKLGATVAPFSPDLKKEELGELLADLRPKRVVYDGVEFEPGLGLSIPSILGDTGEGGGWDTAPASAPALIIYTSGSTGLPKGAVFRHEALTFANRAWCEIMGLGEKDVVLGVLPYSHNYGLYIGLLAPLLAGASVAMLERFTPEAVFDLIAKYRVTIFPGVATMFRRLLNSPLLGRADLSSLRIAVSGAAPCPKELREEWRRRTGTRIVAGYGATEVPRPISFFHDDAFDSVDAVGRVVPGAEIKVVDEKGRVVPQGEVGELWIKFPGAMEGYLDSPEETRGVLTDGWFRTGDLALLTPEGFVRIVGRKRERILRGGFSVFPQEVEAVLLSHPAVGEAAVVGAPDPDLGEEVYAFVALRPSARVTSEELIQYAKERLAHYKFPRGLSILEELPKGPTGKVLKSELARCAEKIRRGKKES